MKKRWLATLWVMVLLSCGVHAAVSGVSLNPASQGWKERSFSGNTEYSVVTMDGRQVVQGKTSGAASTLYKEVEVNVSKTPFISWEWKVKNTFDNPDEQKKKGDDFPARVYVVYRKGLFPWNTLALNYVWSSHHDTTTHWKSAYTDKSHVVVVQHGDDQLDQWVLEKRNVVEDFKTYFGVNIRQIDGFAVMVDGDNTGSDATSWFANIDFTEQ